MTQDVLRVIAPTKLPVLDGGSPFSVPVVFWRSRFLRESDFLHHLPFLFWLIDACRPRRYVELGVGTGVAYFAACQTIDKLVPGGRCFGIDSWTNSDGKSALPEPIRWRNTEMYSEFSRLTAGDPAGFHAEFSPSSVDLLLVNSRLEAVLAEDFQEAWGPKLSERAVVLCRGTLDRLTKEGVDLGDRADAYPMVSFENGEGLTAILWGSARNERLLKLAELSALDEGYDEVHQVFSRLGAAHYFEWLSRAEKERAREVRTALTLIEKAHSDQGKKLKASEAAYDERASLIAGLQSTIFDLQSDGGEKSGEINQLIERLDASAIEADRLTEELAVRASEIGRLAADLSERDAEVARLTEQLPEHDAEIGRLIASLSERDAEITLLNDKLSQRQADFERQTASLDDRFREIATLTQELMAMSGDLATVRGALDERTAEADAARIRIADQEGDNGQLLKENANLRARIADGERDNGRLLKENANLRARIADRERDNGRLLKKNADLHARIAEQAAAIEHMTAEQQSLHDGMALLHARIEKLKQTASWRMTAPVRWTRRVARRSIGLEN